MTARKKPDGVLRGAATHAQPRSLPRSPRQRAEGAVASSQGVAGVELMAQRSPGHDDGYQQGLEEGRAAGLQEGLHGAQQRVDEAVRKARQDFEGLANQRLEEFKSEAIARLAQLERVLASFETASARRVAELEDDAIALAYGAVCKLMGEQAGGAAAIADVVRQGMAQLRGSTLLAVRMNESDLRTLLGDEQGRRLQAAAPQVKWTADPAVAAGGCLIDTTAGSLDARLDTQLASLRALWAAAGTGSTA